MIKYIFFRDNLQMGCNTFLLKTDHIFQDSEVVCKQDDLFDFSKIDPRNFWHSNGKRVLFIFHVAKKTLDS